jgi:hypothetical protein
LLPTYKGIAQVSFGSGDTILFWNDIWNGRVLKFTYPELFSFATKENVTLKEVLASVSFQSNFQLPLSEEAFYQFCDLSIFLQALEINGDNDSWSYIWGNRQYSSAKAYKHLSGSQPVHPALKWIWRSTCQMKHKVFFWLFLMDRLNTRGLLRRKSMHLESYTCEMCLLQSVKNVRRLFLRCSFMKNCWLRIGVHVPTWLKPDRATRYIKRSLGV